MQVSSQARPMDGNDLENMLGEAYHAVYASCQFLARTAHYSGIDGVAHYLPIVGAAVYRLRAFEATVKSANFSIVSADLAVFADALAKVGTGFSSDNGSYSRFYQTLGKAIAGLCHDIKGLSVADSYMESLRFFMALNRPRLLHSVRVLQSLEQDRFNCKDSLSLSELTDLLCDPNAHVIRPRGSP